MDWRGGLPQAHRRHDDALRNRQPHDRHLNSSPATAAVALDIPDGRTLHIDGETDNGSNIAYLLVSGSSAATIAASGANHTGAITAGMPNQPAELLIQQNSTADADIGARSPTTAAQPIR